MSPDTDGSSSSELLTPRPTRYLQPGYVAELQGKWVFVLPNAVTKERRVEFNHTLNMLELYSI